MLYNGPLSKKDKEQMSAMAFERKTYLNAAS